MVSVVAEEGLEPIGVSAVAESNKLSSPVEKDASDTDVEEGTLDWPGVVITEVGVSGLLVASLVREFERKLADESREVVVVAVVAVDSKRDEASGESTPGATERVLVVEDSVLEALPGTVKGVDNTEAPREEVDSVKSRDNSVDVDTSVEDVGLIKSGSAVTESNRLDENWADLSEIEVPDDSETPGDESEVETSKLGGLRVLVPGLVL